MQKRRTERLAEEIRREIAGVLTDSIKDPRLQLVTVSRVEVTNDLGHARVYISVLGDETKQKEAEESLNRAKGFIRSEVSNRVRLRHAPEISFRIDHSIEHGVRISNMLDEMAGREQAEDEE